jgi:hypothetical protein
MKQKELSQLSNQELLEFAKQNKPSPLLDAFFIGFLGGIIVFSIVANSLVFLSLIPLFLIYLFLKKPMQYEALKKELNRRNLN